MRSANFGEPLIPCEVRVLELLAKGRATKQVAADLNLSTRTVETHIRRARQKLGARTTCQLGYLLAKNGIEPRGEIAETAKALF